MIINATFKPPHETSVWLHLMRSSGWYLYQTPHQAQHSYSRCRWFSAPCVLTEFLLWYFPWFGKKKQTRFLSLAVIIKINDPKNVLANDRWQESCNNWLFFFLEELTSWSGKAASYELLLKRRLRPGIKKTECREECCGMLTLSVYLTQIVADTNIGRISSVTTIILDTSMDKTHPSCFCPPRIWPAVGCGGRCDFWWRCWRKCLCCGWWNCGRRDDHYKSACVQT